MLYKEDIFLYTFCHLLWMRNEGKGAIENTVSNGNLTGDQPLPRYIKK